MASGSHGRRSQRACVPSALDRCAYVTLLFGSDVEYALGALLVASTLRQVGSQARVVLLHTADVPQARLPLLGELYDEVRLIRDPVCVPVNSPLCSCARDYAHRQFLKLHLLEMEFDLVLYLDCDVLVRKNIDELFDLEAPAAMDRILAMPPHGSKLPNRVTYEGRRTRGIQGGVMLLAPDRELFVSMRQEVEDSDALRRVRYQGSIGNEQDYLTWRYCRGFPEEEGFPRVWTHLGCEYNYEVHAASTYFDVGRERWLWLDYERDAAVLHFSAPFHKRAKQLLRGPIAIQPPASETEELGGDDPRVGFAQDAWDAEIESLRTTMAAKGIELMDWLGEGLGAHRSTFIVVGKSDSAMTIEQVGAGESLPECCLVFEAFTANCAQGLLAMPPAFAPGPPWGASFWAHSPAESKVSGGIGYLAMSGDPLAGVSPVPSPLSYDGVRTRIVTARTESDLGDCGGSGGGFGSDCSIAGDGGTGGSCGADCGVVRSFGRCEGIVGAVNLKDCGITSDCDVGGLVADRSEAGERRAHPDDPMGDTYTLCEFIQFEDDNGMPPRYGEFLWDQAGDKKPMYGESIKCYCADQRGGRAPVVRNSIQEGLEDVGAWVQLCGIERWAFGLLSDPPHLSDCAVFRLFAVFRVKVLERVAAEE